MLSGSRSLWSIFVYILIYILIYVKCFSFQGKLIYTLNDSRTRLHSPQPTFATRHSYLICPSSSISSSSWDW
ncbi:hypothetical protein VIGAN_02210800 [Vigna angularis var. angularis]|uniref:Uncharacterized protein n=1 Tax=Vigna angularis var. angularis TaxID=157739 RepID=A0A0S3RF50_PHAAN|nr:hypothetical protein VIGAN_02210800 [Vigna angularis var. angularis]